MTAHVFVQGFPDSSVGKQSACDAMQELSVRFLGREDPLEKGEAPHSSILGLGRSTGEGTGSPFQYSWASLVAQLVKNLPAMRETWVQSLGWEDPLGKGKANYSSILAWRIPLTE